jgi:superfamily I DNA/RNA helicase
VARLGIGEAEVAAGDSADRWADEKLAQANALAAEVRRLRSGSSGERALVDAVAPLRERGWVLLADRRWPGTNGANIDLIMVGPGGIFLIDAKNWSSPHLTGDRLFNGADDRADAVDQVLAATEVVATSLSMLDVVPAAVTPLLVFVGRPCTGNVQGVRMIGLAEIVCVLTERPDRLSAESVQRVAAHLEAKFPPHAGTPEPANRVESDGALFDLYDHTYEVQRRALHGSVEDWMTFLHPDQNALVRRSWNGPARISGSAGTGKTVVAVHRAVHLARRTPGRILFTAYVKSLPRSARGKLALLDSGCLDRVDFMSLHGWAFDFLRDRGRPIKVKREAIDLCFKLAWAKLPGQAALTAIAHHDFWREEIDDLIKGRGITELNQYLELRRRGRGTLRGPHRHIVWELFQRYEQRRQADNLYDFNDMVSHTLAEVRRRPVDPPYAAVIVDEAQDLNLIQMKLAHAIIGDVPNGLLLVGDGRQNVYHHSYRLAEAGLSIRGDRAQVLRINYRNTAAVHAAAQQIGRGQAFDDPDGFAVDADDSIVVIIEGGAVDDYTGPAAGLKAAMIKAIKAKNDPGSCAVLCERRSAVKHWLTELQRAGLDAQDLDDYDFTSTNRVKVGTVDRSKGLEFKHVFLPQWHHYAIPAALPETPAADRAELLGRRAYVGVTRARDTVWRGSLKR